MRTAIRQFIAASDTQTTHPNSSQNSARAMLGSQLCWRRCLQGLLSAQSSVTHTKLPSSTLAAPRLRRLLSTTPTQGALAQKQAFRQDDNISDQPGAIAPGIVTTADRVAFQRSKVQKTSLVRSTPNVKTCNRRSIPKDNSNPTINIPQDPAKLAIQTKKLLSSTTSSTRSVENRMLPLTLVRAATSAHTTDPTAAWNELISHAMKIGDTSGAYKHFNDMKKRGCSPNSHTYTILLSGLALPHNAEYSTSLPRALATYRALRERDRDTKGGKGKAEWNLIHTNAVLKMCSRVGAVDEMWQIVGELPEEGKNAADARTYTSLLNGMRQMRGPGGIPSDWYKAAGKEKWNPDMIDIIERRKIEDLVDDAERMWSGLLTRWSKGKLTIDEELVCAMARMRLSSTRPRDWRKIFSMMEEIYGIPNFYVGNGNIPPPEEGKIHWKPHSAPKAQAATLAVILETAVHTDANPTIGKAYWDYFTINLKVKPDLDNHHDYLRLLLRFKDGQNAAILVDQMVENATATLKSLFRTNMQSSGRKAPSWFRDKRSNATSSTQNELPPLPVQKTFTIALACCRRISTAGSTTSIPKHSYMYASALRILAAFDKLYSMLSSPNLPPPRRATELSPASYHFQSPPSQVIVSPETACKVYAKFLDTAAFLAGQDPLVAKQALRRVTSTPGYGKDKDNKPHERGGIADAASSPPSLPPHLPTLLSSSLGRTPPYILDFAQAILGLANNVIQDPRAKWGHKERDALQENIKMLKSALGSPPSFRNKISSDTKEFSEDNTSRQNFPKYPSIRQQQELHRGRGRAGVVKLDENSPETWEPDSSRDREAKKKELWGYRARVGLKGSAGKVKHSIHDSSRIPPLRIAINRVWDGSGEPPSKRAIAITPTLISTARKDDVDTTSSSSANHRSFPSPTTTIAPSYIPKRHLNPSNDDHKIVPGVVTPQERRINDENRSKDKRWEAFTSEDGQKLIGSDDGGRRQSIGTRREGRDKNGFAIRSSSGNDNRDWRGRVRL